MDPRRRWLAVAVIALVAGIAGILAVWLGSGGSSAHLQREDLDSLQEIAGLPVPKLAPDWSPQYRELVEESRQVACRLVQSFPSDAQAVAALALVHNLAHDDAGEVACWQKCLELDRKFLMAYSNLARRATEKGEYEKAETLLREAIQAGAAADFTDLLASALTAQGKLAEAARVLENALAGRSATLETCVQLGEVYLRLNEFQKAKDQFQKVIHVDGASARAYHGLIQAAARLGEAQEAEKYQAELARLKKSEDQANRKGREQITDERIVPGLAAQILTMAARVYRSHRQADVAEQQLRRAAELDPRDVACRAVLADLYNEQQRLEEALGIVEELRQLEPRNLAHLKALGIVQGRLGRWDAAQKTFEELRVLAPDRAVGYAGLAEGYLRTGKDLPRARALATTAAKLEPSAWNHFILAAICERQGDMDAARAALKKAIALDPNNPQYRQVYATIGGKD